MPEPPIPVDPKANHNSAPGQVTTAFSQWLVLDLTLSPPNTAEHINEAPFHPGSTQIGQIWLPLASPAPLLTWEEVLHLAKHSSKWSSTAMKRF